MARLLLEGKCKGVVMELACIVVQMKILLFAQKDNFVGAFLRNFGARNG